jgi:hypothetical protein
MKKIITLLIISLFVLLFSHSAFAKEDTLLAITEYRNGQDMDALFSQSQRVLSYTEGGEGIPGKILSLLSENQVHALIDQDIHPKVIDSNPDINRYILLYNPRRDQEDVLKPYGETIKISPYYTLLKLPPNTDFNNEGPASKFFRIPFVEKVERPIETTPVVPNLSPTPKPTTEKRNGWQLVILMTLGIVMIGVVGFFVWKKLRSRSQISSN